MTLPFHSMVHTRVRVPLVAALAAAACAGDDAATRAAEHAHDVPASALHIVGASDTLAQVRDVKMGAGDTIWVLNSAAPFLVAFTNDGGGRPARAWGRSGRGPREFTSPTALGIGPDGAVWVIDQARHALIRASGSEDDWHEIGLPRDSLPPERLIGSDQIGMSRPWLAHRDGAFVFAVTSIADPAAPRMWNSRLVAFEPAARQTHTIFTTRHKLADPTARWASLTLLMPHPLWDVCADGAIVAYDPARNEILRFRDGHAVGAAAKLPPEREVAVTLDRFFAVQYRSALERFTADRRPDSIGIRNMIQSEMESFGPRFGTVFPEYAELRCAPSGEAWIQLFDIDAGRFGKGDTWLRAALDGSVQTARLPAGFAPFQFLAGRILGVVTDAYDVSSIAWIDI